MSERTLGATELAMLASIGRGPDGRSTDIASGAGTPPWLGSALNFCSRCGERLVAATPPGENRERMLCAACGLVAYVNPRIVVTTLPVDAHGDLVLIRRGIEPGRGTWAQPGGFLEVDETVGEAAVRETLEETGLLVEPGALIGLYSRLEAAVVSLAYEARVVGGAPQPCAEALEVVAYRPGEIPWAEIALTTSFWAIRDWVILRHPEVATPASFAGPASL